MSFSQCWYCASTNNSSSHSASCFAAYCLGQVKANTPQALCEQVVVSSLQSSSSYSKFNLLSKCCSALILGTKSHVIRYFINWIDELCLYFWVIASFIPIINRRNCISNGESAAWSVVMARPLSLLHNRIQTSGPFEPVRARDTVGGKALGMRRINAWANIGGKYSSLFLARENYHNWINQDGLSRINLVFLQLNLVFLRKTWFFSRKC